MLVWRIVVGLSLIPAFGTLYHRLTLAESTRFLNTRKQPADAAAPDPQQTPTEQGSTDEESSKLEKNDAIKEVPPEVQEIVKKKAPFRGTYCYGYIAHVSPFSFFQNSLNISLNGGMPST
jgi:MFS transporter, PHS family, inorganic phosphate transporter